MEPSTDYWVVAATNLFKPYAWRLAGSVNATTETGWSVGGVSKKQISGGSWSNNFTVPFLLELKGSAVVDVVLLSNSDLGDVSTGSNTEARARVGTIGSSKYEKAVPFETGSNSTGYVLTQLTAEIGYNDLAVSPQISIYTDSSGLPGSVVTGGALTPPAAPAATGVYDLTFTSS